MRNSEIKGLVVIIFLVIYAIYWVFKNFFLYSLIILIIILFISGFLLYKYYKNRKKEQKERKRYYEKVNTIHVDKNGYERDGLNRLIHRKIAYENIYKKGYKKGILTKQFRYYDVHHIDGNKRNNSPSNLQVLTREEHKELHGH